MARPKRGEAQSGRLHQLGMAMLGNYLSGGGMSGVTVNPNENEFTDEETNQLLSKPEEQRDEEASSIPTHPTVTADHWWTENKAQNLNNQLRLNEINQSQDIFNKLKLQKQLDPLEIEKMRQMGVNTTEQGRISGNNQLLNSIGAVATPRSVDTANLLLNQPAIDSALAKHVEQEKQARMLGEGYDTTRLTNEALTPDSMAKAAADSALGVKASQYNLTDFPNQVKEKEALANANLLLKSNEAKAALFKTFMPGGGAVNAGTGQVIFQSAKPEDAMQGIMDSVAAKMGVSGSLPKFAPVITNGTNQPSILAPNPNPTNQPTVEPVYDTSGKKVGSKVNGVFVPLKNK